MTRLGKHGIREFISTLENCDIGLLKAEKIFVVSPYYTHRAGNNLLISLAKKGVVISVLLQSDAWDKGSNSITQSLIINLRKVIRDGGIRKCKDLHAKMYIISYIDGGIDTWIGSSNFTFRADGSVSTGTPTAIYPRNIETIEKIVIDDPVKFELRKMWRDGDVI